MLKKKKKSVAEGIPQKASGLDARMAHKVPFIWSIPWSGMWSSASQTQNLVYYRQTRSIS